MASFLPRKIHRNDNGLNCSSERGVFIVMGALWMGMFVALIALALDTFMVGTAKMHQSSTVEYIALGTLRTLKEPPSGGSYGGSPTDDVAQYNFAIDRGALAGTSNLPGSTAAQVQPSNLRIRTAQGGDDDDENCAGGGGGPGPGGDDGREPCTVAENSPGSCDVKERWCGFESSSAVGAVIFGVYTPAFGVNPATFAPAAAGSSAAVNAVKVRLQLQDPNISPFVLPFGKFLMGENAIKFESSAIAIYEGSGQYRLVR